MKASLMMTQVATAVLPGVGALLLTLAFRAALRRRLRAATTPSRGAPQAGAPR